MTTPTIVREFEAELVVTDYVVAADDVVAVTLAAADGSALPPWTPGAHVDLVLGADLTRQYSLCSSPGDRTAWRLGILRTPDSRGGSKAVHSDLNNGSTVRVRGPRNHFPLVSAAGYLFIAGGIGITPMLPMIAAADAVGADWQLLYGGRTRASMAYLDELGRYGDRVTVCARDEAATFRGTLETLLAGAHPDTLVYCCGPEGLLTAAEDGCRHWPEHSLHVERFSAKAAEDIPDALDTFEVECQRSGVTLTVPLDKTIYEVAEDAGLDVLGSCMEGVCGTCECDVLDGDPDHRDSVLNEAEKAAGASIMICISRSRSQRLVLDL